ncbi:hypothetical protein LZ30DRAFT_687768 [Colletotrichum cereale]|nr:hypothetical protein LZ30DRAFT_687768 [Colletotrichum cereale]
METEPLGTDLLGKWDQRRRLKCHIRRLLQRQFPLDGTKEDYTDVVLLESVASYLISAYDTPGSGGATILQLLRYLHALPGGPRSGRARSARRLALPSRRPLQGRFSGVVSGATCADVRTELHQLQGKPRARGLQIFDP